MSRKVALVLVDAANDFQQRLRGEAEAAAASAGLSLALRWSGADLTAQMDAIQEFLDAPEEERPAAVLVMAVRDQGLPRASQRAVEAGVGFVYLNRTRDDLAPLRIKAPKLPLGTVCIDELETGRIQGRQFRRLLPTGGRVVYAQGSRRSLAATDRTAGMEEAVRDSGLEVIPVEAGWSQDEAREALTGYLSIALRTRRHIDLVGCQNDLIAAGALQALEHTATLGTGLSSAIAVTGCDGTPELGQKLLAAGRIVATIELPSMTGLAVSSVGRCLSRGGQFPEMSTVTGRSIPDEARLAPLKAP